MKKSSIFFMAMMLSTALHAQQTLTQYLYWLRYQNQLILNEKIYWVNEIDNRRFFDPDVQNQLIIHSRLHFNKGKWNVGGGLTYSMAFAQKPENGFDHVFKEIRPVLEGSHEQSLGKKIFLQNRIRTDFRFIQSQADESVWDESIFVARFRYRLQIRFPLKVNEENITTVGLKIADEIMVNSKKNTFDQNRIYVTTDFYLNRKLSLELGYLYIHQQRFGKDEFLNRNVVRFSVLHKIFL